MKRLLVVIWGLLQLGVAAPALGAACISQSLADYIALGATGCTIGGVTFTDFSEVTPVTPGAVQIASNTITLAPLASGGFAFSNASGGAISANPGDLLELWFGFRATGGPGFASNTIALDGSAVATGEGTITIVEDKCLEGSFASPSSGCSGTPVTQIVFAIDGLSELEQTADFVAAASFFDVFIDLVIDGGPEESTGSAQLGPQLGEFRTTAGTSSVPEPETLALLASSLLVLAAMRRARRRCI